MGKTLSLLLTLISILFTLSACSDAEKDSSTSLDHGKWVSLFNGKDLQGWIVECKPDDKNKDFWRADSGAIVCNSIGRPDHDYVWLITEKEFDDFELKMKIQSFRDCPGNSGVQVRSRFDTEEQWLDGPQIDIHPPDPWRSGYIYDETREFKRWIHPSLTSWDIERSQVKGGQNWKHADDADGWNTIHIVCNGTTIKTDVNGNQIADFNGAGILDDAAHSKHKVGMKGNIALQLHSDDQLHIKYKDIYLKPL
ncbi:MAG: 3-keto-disaccharide hydrolase [Planctomycetota bacterium]|jgi:hypothetical protein